MHVQRFISPAVWQNRSIAFVRCVMAGLVGVLISLTMLVLADASLTWLAAACVLLVGVVIMLAIGQVRRPLLALLAFTLPLHLDAYFGKFHVSSMTFPDAALGRVTITDLLLGALLLLWLAETALGRQRHVRFFGWVTVPAVFFILICVLSVLIAQEPRLAIYELSELGKGFLVFLYMANRVQDERDLQWVLAGLCASLLLEGSLGLYQAILQAPAGLTFIGERAYLGRQMLGTQVAVRPTGTLWHANHFSMFLGLTLPVAAAILLVPASRKRRWLTSVAVLLGVVAAVYTLSRGAWVGLTVSALVLAALGIWKKVLSGARVAAIFSVLVMVAIGTNALLGGILVRRLTTDDLRSAQSRIPLMRGALTVVADHPVLGSGFANYALTIKTYDITGEFTQSGILPVVHNVFLLIAAETGLLGLGVFLWLLVALAKRGLNTVRTRPMSLAVAVTAGLLASELYLVIHNSVDFGLLGDPQLLYVFWFQTGLMVALTARAGAASMERLRR